MNSPIIRLTALKLPLLVIQPNQNDRQSGQLINPAEFQDGGWENLYMATDQPFLFFEQICPE